MAREAAEHALLNPSEDALQSEAEGYDTITVSRQFIDKFAELLIRECVMIVTGFDTTQEVASDDYEPVNAMKQHFGVE